MFCLGIVIYTMMKVQVHTGKSDEKFLDLQYAEEIEID